MRTGLIAAVVVLLPLLHASTLPGSESSDIYFPLKQGMTWTYEIISDKHPTKKITITNMPPREIDNLKLTLRKTEVGGSTTYFLIGSDDKGIYRYGEQKSENSTPIIAQPRDYYIKNPAGVGTTWDTTTKLGPEEVTINLTIESTTDSVTAPAGAFKDCLKIKSMAGNQKKDSPLTLEAYDWYAPNVGLVKSMVTITRVEKDQKKNSEHLTYQLESFKP